MSNGHGGRASKTGSGGAAPVRGRARARRRSAAEAIEQAWLTDRPPAAPTQVLTEGVEHLGARGRLAVERALDEAWTMAAGIPPPGAVRIRSMRAPPGGTERVVAASGHGWSLVGLTTNAGDQAVLLLDAHPEPLDVTNSRLANGLLDALAQAGDRSRTNL